ncbi:MAG: murein L,D-transpeptidase catalytic domain-containing protein [Ferruginibacter sp.]
MRWLTILLLAAASISAFAVFNAIKNNARQKNKNAAVGKHAVTDIRKATMVRLKQYACDVKAYTSKNNLNNRYCFLIDMKIPSGSKRFFIYDLENDSIMQAGLVTHGSGINISGDSLAFSNNTGSNCTSLGKYKIGKSYHGKFGPAWKLYGLDRTNSNAFNRFVVLHAHPCVPENEIAPLEICRSWGCPTISPLFLSSVKKYLDNSSSPILLWIFY